MDFWMVCHYFYDGEGRHDMDYVKPCSDDIIAASYIAKVIQENDDYEWSTGPDGFMTALRQGPGRYAYDYYFVEKMTMNEEI